MSYKAKDYTGRKYGKLTFIERTDKTIPKGGYIWRLKCDCGNDQVFFGASNVICGRNKSCGCLKQLRIDRTGQKFYRFTFIRPCFDRRNCNGTFLWELLCDCGKTHYATAQAVIRGNTQSCGCLAVENHALYGSSRQFDPLISAARKVWMTGYDDGDIDFDTFLALSQQNCSYCGAEPYTNYVMKYGVGQSLSVVFTYNGLDRVDSSENHLLSNVVPCCRICNWMKSTMTVPAFLLHVARIFLYRCIPFLFGLGLLSQLLPTKPKSNGQGIDQVALGQPSDR
jgi:hypothetical protein